MIWLSLGKVRRVHACIQISFIHLHHREPNFLAHVIRWSYFLLYKYMYLDVCLFQFIKQIANTPFLVHMYYMRTIENIKNQNI